MSIPRLIALCSPAMGSGKSTVADYLTLKHGFMPVAFATPLKRMAGALLDSLDIPKAEVVERVYGSRKEEIVPILDITSRQLQQKIGTELGRDSIRPSLWVDIAIGVARKLLDQGHSVVIDDMRFPNEYAAVLAAGGESWRIQRPGAVVTSSHVSEGQLNHLPLYTFVNSGSIEDLHTMIDEALVAPPVSRYA